jgi:hypothetical protein
VAEATGHGGSFAEAFRDALDAAVRAAGGAGGAPRSSYTARSPRAQYKHLASTARGRQALQDAGITAAPQTRRRWLTGRQNPGKANREAIAEAYRAMQRGGIPDSVRRRDFEIKGRVGTGSDIRDRGTRTHAPLRIRGRSGTWNRLDAIYRSGEWDLLGDGGVEDLISEDLIEADIGGSDGWFFPGGSYTVTFK